MMSLSGSSDSRKSSCAMTIFAIWSSTAMPRKTMRSLSRREKISQPRSPRWVCSMTVGMIMLLIMGAPSDDVDILALGSRMSFPFSALGRLGSGLFGRNDQPLLASLIGRDDQAVWIFVDDLSQI